MIIGDGLKKGTDEALVPIDGEYVKEAKDRSGDHGCGCIYFADAFQRDMR